MTIAAYGSEATPVIISFEVETGWALKNSFIYFKQNSTGKSQPKGKIFKRG